ncbi:2324_t:CDS:2, partial [Diversispora eburnea]
MDSINNLYRNFKDLKDLKLKNLNLQKSLKPMGQEQEELFDDMAKNLENLRWDGCIINVEELKKNSKQISQMMGQQNKITESTLSMIEEISNLLNSQENLSCYKRWVSYFITEVKEKLDSDTWKKVNAAFGFKIRHKNAGFREKDEIYILHENQTIEEAIEQFEKSFPDDLKDFKNPLKKVFEALDKWDSD